MKRFFILFIIFIFSCIYFAGNEAQALRWESTELNVYIEYHPKKPVVKKAFWAWQSLTKLVTFKYVDKEEQADITVKFTRETIPNSDGYHTLGVTKYFYDENGYLQKAEITLLSVRPGTNMLAKDKDAYMVALHEAGHALGLPHSRNPSDAMYFAYSGQPLVMVNDLNALRRLYGVPVK